MDKAQNESVASQDTRSWLLVDCAHQGEVRLARVLPSAAPALGSIRRYDSNIPTFTDVLQCYQKDSGHRLIDLRPIIAIGGVPGGEAMNVERSRWVISRSGLASLFGVPATILNEVAAQAWALRASVDGVSAICGKRAPNLKKRGRYLFLTYEEGVGTAVIDIDDHGRCVVLDAEGGQIDFLPLADDEHALLPTIAGRAAQAISWEQVLMTRRTAADTGSNDSNRLFARLLGRFVSNLIYTTGAWDGAFMTGRLVPRPQEMNADFVTGLTYQRPYHRQLGNTACWQVSQSEAVLKGCAAMFAYRYFGTMAGPAS